MLPPRLRHLLLLLIYLFPFALPFPPSNQLPLPPFHQLPPIPFPSLSLPFPPSHILPFPPSHTPPSPPAPPTSLGFPDKIFPSKGRGCSEPPIAVEIGASRPAGEADQGRGVGSCWRDSEAPRLVLSLLFFSFFLSFHWFICLFVHFLCLFSYQFSPISVVI